MTTKKEQARLSALIESAHRLAGMRPFADSLRAAADALYAAAVEGAPEPTPKELAAALLSWKQRIVSHFMDEYRHQPTQGSRLRKTGHTTKNGGR